MWLTRAMAVLMLTGCPGARVPVAEVDNRGAELDDGSEPDCFLGEASCRLEVDLDGDGRLDAVELVRDRACGPSDDDHRCQQGLRVAFARGEIVVIGAGHQLAARPVVATEPGVELEPIDLDADLGFLVRVAVLPAARLRAQTPRGLDGDALVLDGGDAAVALCWVDGAPVALHLGY